MKLLVKNIGMLATPIGNEASSDAKILILNDAYILCEDGKITAIGSGEVPGVDCPCVDAEGKLVTPGLIDAHTHLVFGGWREHELAMKRQGVPYLEILAQGGGILSTVRHTRQATEEVLREKALMVLREMLALGVTACEAKSGYGLDIETELKQLHVTRKLNDLQPIELVSTYLGAHAVPNEYKHNREGYLVLMESLIERIAEEKLAEFCDVFCEEGVFTAKEAARILKHALRNGLKVKMHADEIHPIGGTQVAGALGATSVEHLIAATDEGIEAMKQGGSIAMLLPATSFYLNKPYARAKDMIAAGVPVAVGSDFNPGSCPSFNLQLVMNLACWNYGLTPEQVLSAVTLNAAAAIGRADRIGTLEVGKQADIVLWNAPNLDYIFYRFGQNLTNLVIKHGNIVWKG